MVKRIGDLVRKPDFFYHHPRSHFGKIHGRFCLYVFHGGECPGPWCGSRCLHIESTGAQHVFGHEIVVLFVPSLSCQAPEMHLVTKSSNLLCPFWAPTAHQRNGSKLGYTNLFWAILGVLWNALVALWGVLGTLWDAPEDTLGCLGGPSGCT